MDYFLGFFWGGAVRQVCDTWKVIPKSIFSPQGPSHSSPNMLLGTYPFMFLAIGKEKSHRRKAQLRKLIQDTDLTTLHALVYVVEVPVCCLWKCTQLYISRVLWDLPQWERRGLGCPDLCMGMHMPSQWPEKGKDGEVFPHAHVWISLAHVVSSLS